ncbi:MAG TPA: carboxymuconolactone decarboxylase family protein [Bacteroidetes bacterium]|nr:carboxymuconolactone decarboxylase family protein [bacterium BMS3Bbin04]HDO64467.1 carboxymuconolactone decarboxylase family protein [Bacteroidota bacterium]HEX03592.1 carboxymuconolactone decarboxylase family protein [Bacteroidota bacterium]
MDISSLEQFHKNREDGNELILKNASTSMKRLMNLDVMAYKDGALNASTKELLGLVASTVLRCDDCISYHTVKCHELGTTIEEFEEAMTIAYVVGGSIVVPHLRRALARWEQLETSKG